MIRIIQERASGWLSAKRSYRTTRDLSGPAAFLTRALSSRYTFPAPTIEAFPGLYCRCAACVLLCQPAHLSGKVLQNIQWRLSEGMLSHAPADWMCSRPL